MKIIAASLIATATAFAPSPLSSGTTALSMHALGGWTPSGMTTPTKSYEQTASATAPPAAASPAFSGFAHATQPLGPNNSPFKNQEPIKATQQTAAAPAPEAAAAPVFSGFGHAYAATATPEVAAVPDAPIFSGFGHATGPMGGNPSIPVAARSTGKSYLENL
mmetsp:Transcript_2454/g.3621  ORF Transcript_2454/g.3621 Transcript_2454/m.3621 type:complete len:163 (-) Transcript_2454:51-539(-)